ncbi:LysE family translocator [Poseidonibacter lekithochrous]|nr:LysE family translocator [Poseidonibacter lekithochrous]
MIISISVFILTTHISPGPTNIILLSSVLNFGYKKSMPFMFGCIISYPLLMIFTGMGIGLFLIQYPSLMQILKVIGIIYLSWMAYKILKDNSSYDTNNNVQNKPFTFLQAFSYTILNPKAWVVYTSAVSIFVTSQEESFWQISIIVFITLIAMIITVYTWLFGGIVLKKFIKDEKFIKKINTVMAILLLASIVPIII